jgi:hypothetical protein
VPRWPFRPTLRTIQSMLFRRRAELEPPNISPDWATSDEWRSWEAPRNFIAGESHHTDELRALCGEPRDGGYLIPVEVVLSARRTIRSTKMRSERR